MFFYDLPPEYIAQSPTEPRDHSKLMILDPNTRRIDHKYFYDIINYLNPGDLLVLNDSKVLPARLIGYKKDTGAHIEFLLVEEKNKNVWEVLVKPGKRVKIGSKIIFGCGKLEAEIIDILENGSRLAEFSYEGNFFDILEEIGMMPLPHYITETLKDANRYQTVYSKDLGSIAAPTAGLHFTSELLSKIKDKGINIAFVTLHVGIGTFRPVSVEDITQHQMHEEHYYLPQETADAILKTKEHGGKVYAVGTTACRTLESVAAIYDPICESSGYTDIFIYPPYQFRIIDGLITNFHLPESTLIMLVSAFAEREFVLDSYSKAINNNYRFYSFGDAMLILPKKSR